MLNKHNVLHKSLYTLHKNADFGFLNPETGKNFGHAVVVIVVFADDVGQSADVLHQIGRAHV